MFHLKPYTVPSLVEINEQSFPEDNFFILTQSVVVYCSKVYYYYQVESKYGLMYSTHIEIQRVRDNN